MDQIVHLESSDFDRLLEGRLGGSNFLGQDGLLYLDERAFDWYALVINPFTDYAFTSGNMVLAMVDWGGDEWLSGNPPLAADAFTERQWALIHEAVTTARKLRDEILRTSRRSEAVLVLGLHTPVFCPLQSVDLEHLHDEGADVDDDDLRRGTMKNQRQALIELFVGEPPKTALSDSHLPPISAYTLAGHSHVSDVFQHPDAPPTVPGHPSKTVKRYSTGGSHGLDLEKSPAHSGLHINTVSAGPPADGEKGKREQRAPGGRIVRFGKTGRPTTLEEVAAKTAKWGEF